MVRQSSLNLASIVTSKELFTSQELYFFEMCYAHVAILGLYVLSVPELAMSTRAIKMDSTWTIPQ